ncbi:hypothetical protein Tco_1037956 [Tanacetum coccineum]
MRLALIPILETVGPGGWFTKKSGSANAVRRTTWFDLILKSNIDQNEDHILGPSIVAIAKKLKEIIQKDELIIADLEGAGLEKLKLHYKNDVELEYHVDQLNIEVVFEAQWNIDEGDTLALKRSMLHLSPNIMLQVQDKMHHLPLEDERDFNNALLLFIRTTLIKNRVEDLALGVESYQRTINLTKPKLYFKGINENIPYTMTGTGKGVVYLNGYNHRSLMKLNEVHKFSDGTLTKIQENLIEMPTKNKLGRGNERLKRRDWNDKDIKKSKEMVNKINQVMKHRECC